MKPTNFARYLSDFFSVYLTTQKNVSKNTIYSYRDTFKLLLKFCQDVKGIAIERVSIDSLTVKLIKDFLNWLEDERKCSISTRNQRLASIHSFFRYIQGEEPAGIHQFQQVMSISIKKTEKKVLEHLSPRAMKLILEQPDKSSPKGRRDLTLLSVLYDTGARVQELVDIKVNDVTLDPPPVILLTGKGNKARRVPLMKNTVALLQQYLLENDLNKQWKNKYPLFKKNQHNKLTK
jgi:integrase/recombinase XerD